MTSNRWRLTIAGPAERQLRRLPEKVAAAVLASLATIAENPRRAGKPLHFEFEGVWAARRGPYRVLYEIDGRRRLITVTAVGHRSDVYRRRMR